jgi:histidine decarboxylase
MLQANDEMKAVAQAQLIDHRIRDDRFNAYFTDLDKKKSKHLGYPYNLDFDYTSLGNALKYLINNLGDPYVSSNYSIDSRSFEQNVIDFFKSLWSFPEGWGYVTSSGTEGNLAGILYGKCKFPNAHLVFSRQAHYSVRKAGFAYGLPCLEVDSLPSGEIDYEHLERSIAASHAEALILVVNISSTFSGAYDSPVRMKQRAISAGVPSEKIYVHGDGALGGMILPFIDDVPAEYAISGAGTYDSVSASGHKMPGCPVPSGVVVTHLEHMSRFANYIEYLGSVDSTLGGSRCGLAALLLSEALTNRPNSNWPEVVAGCLRNAELLKEMLCESGIEATVNRFSNTVVFPRPDDRVIKEWQLACRGEFSHAVIMPNNTPLILEEFAHSYCSNLYLRQN